jgi:ribonuclease BN (tRNA processing enzyme)
VKLTILGCAGTFPGPESGCSSYLVEHEGYRLLLDAGNGAVGALQRHIDLFGLDAVLLSHLHADHCLDLIAYSYARRYRPPSQPLLSPLPVHAPPGAQERLLRCYEQWPEDGLESTYTFHDVHPGRLELGPFEIDLAPMAHPVECNAIRVTAGGRSLTYSGDTGPTAELSRLAAGTDLALFEASWQHGDPNPPDVHLTGRDAGEHAAKAGVARLLLTHLVPWGDADRTLEEADDVFDGPLEIVRTGAVYEL